MPPVKIAQGRYGKNLTPPCGTVGLGPCVGMATLQPGGGWFVAHIDAPRNDYTRQELGQVSSWVENRLNDLVGTPAHTVYIVTSNANERAGPTQAIISGIIDWCLCRVPYELWASDGLMIDSQRPDFRGELLIGGGNNADKWFDPREVQRIQEAVASGQGKPQRATMYRTSAAVDYIGPIGSPEWDNTGNFSVPLTFAGLATATQNASQLERKESR